MYKTSQFCLEEEKTNEQLQLSAKKINLNSASGIQTAEKSSNNMSATSSSYKCEQCKYHTQIIKSLKNQQIRTDYEYQKFKIQYEKMKRQNEYLLHLKINEISSELFQNNSAYYCKQDLQNELSQAKYLIELLSLSKNKNHQLNYSKQSKKQAQILQSTLLKNNKHQIKKQEDLLLQNMKLQEIIMIKDKIIQQKSLFPLYHYDQRILMLRKGVDFWYRKAQQYCFALKQQMVQLSKNQLSFKKQIESILKYEKSLWINQLKENITNFFSSNPLVLQENTFKNQIIQQSQLDSKNQSFVIDKTRISKDFSSKAQYLSAKSQNISYKNQNLSSKKQFLSEKTQIKDKTKSLLIQNKNNAKKTKPQQQKKTKKMSLNKKCIKHGSPTTNFNCLRCQTRLKS